MVKLLLGNSLLNEALNKVLNSGSGTLKRIVVFLMIMISLLIVGTLPIIKSLFPSRWFSVSDKDIRRIRTAH